MASTSDSNDDGDDTNRCWSNGDPLIQADALCSDNSEDAWYSSSDSTDFDDEQEYIATDPICVTYDIDQTIECGEIDFIFLGVCDNEDTQFDSSLLGVGDLDKILVAGSNVLEVKGARNKEGELGVNVAIESTQELQFTICFETVLVNIDFNQMKNTLDVGQGEVSIKDNILCPVQGLPCLSLVHLLASEFAVVQHFSHFYRYFLWVR